MLLLATASSEAPRVRGALVAYPSFFFRTTPPPKFHDEEMDHATTMNFSLTPIINTNPNIQEGKGSSVFVSIGLSRRATFACDAEDVLQHPTTFCSGPTSSSYAPSITRRSAKQDKPAARKDGETERVRVRVRMRVRVRVRVTVSVKFRVRVRVRVRDLR